MSRTAIILFSLVLVTHYGYSPLATMWPDQMRAERVLFYSLRGIEGFVLYVLVMALIGLARSARSDAPAGSDYAAIAACAWGAIEEGLTAACRLAIGMQTTPAAKSQCDAVTGLPVYALTLCAVVAVLSLWPRRTPPRSDPR